MKKEFFKFYGVVFLFLFLSNLTYADSRVYGIDASHSSISFKVRNFVYKVTGQFKVFEGTVVMDSDQMEKNEVSALIKIESVDTKSVKRDTHLRGEDFFDVKKYPVMAFKSHSWSQISSDQFDVTGDLTLKGITHKILLKTQFLGIRQEGGKTVTLWKASTTLQRSSYGITYGKGTIGEDVEISMEIEALSSTH